MKTKVRDYLIHNKQLLYDLFSKTINDEEYLTEVLSLQVIINKKDEISHDNTMLIEFNKGKGDVYWLDKIRYCKMFLSKSEGNIEYYKLDEIPIITLFIKINNDKKIDKIYIVDTNDIYKILLINENIANYNLESFGYHRSNGLIEDNKIGIKIKTIEPISIVLDFNNTSVIDSNISIIDNNNSVNCDISNKNTKISQKIAVLAACYRLGYNGYNFKTCDIMTQNCEQYNLICSDVKFSTKTIRNTISSQITYLNKEKYLNRVSHGVVKLFDVQKVYDLLILKGYKIDKLHT